MLQTLLIKNYALISHLEIDFSGGFSVITGETGAGKSIILGALSLILGNRADTKSIKEGEEKCYIEAVFDIASYPLKPFFEKRELDSDNPCIVRREIASSGKSRAFINDTPVALSDLKELGEYLIDIHSQHQNLMLADRGFQLQVLDIFADNRTLRDEYARYYEAYSVLCARLDELKEKARINAAEEDFLRFQHQQLHEAKLIPGEQEQWACEREILSNVESIKSGLFNIEQNLADDNNGVLTQLKASLYTARTLSKLYPQAEDIANRIESAFLDLKDLTAEIIRYQESLEDNPSRLHEITDRLDLLYSLQQKHKTTSVEELLSIEEILGRRLQDINNYDQMIGTLEQQIQDNYNLLLDAATKLSLSRRKSARAFEKALIEKVSLLGMPTMRFEVELTPRKEPGRTGNDEVDFHFSADRNSAVRPVAQIASGGEIARLMLGVKALAVDAVSLPTIIFDEIDTGISGEIADRMGEIMHRMGNSMQVIAITHLPQIAARGDAHYLVYKEEAAGSTQTNIRCLDVDERINQLAQMLSGSELTSAAIENAGQLLNKNKR